jgi:2-amino-4-hydroxy-6-hydroxymethyldihydropteridine diphosphokinase
MPRVFVGIGSNIEREKNIRAGVADLRRHFGELSLSTVYESEAVGFDGNNFYNLVAAFNSEESVEVINQTLHEIEDAHGRTREGPRFSSRTLDIDLLLYGDLVLQQGKLDLPRDEITKNAFVLCPMAELAPTLRHPLLNKSYAELWATFDQQKQPLWPVEVDFRKAVT